MSIMASPQSVSCSWAPFSLHQRLPLAWPHPRHRACLTPRATRSEPSQWMEGASTRRDLLRGLAAPAPLCSGVATVLAAHARHGTAFFRSSTVAPIDLHLKGMGAASASLPAVFRTVLNLYPLFTTSRCRGRDVLCLLSALQCQQRRPGRQHLAWQMGLV